MRININVDFTHVRFGLRGGRRVERRGGIKAGSVVELAQKRKKRRGVL